MQNLNKNLILIFSVLLFLQSCATAPGKVFPLSANISRSHNCEYYRNQLAVSKDKEKELALYQKELVSNDKKFVGLAVGFGIFIWPLALLALGVKGDDNNTQEYAKTKGEIEEINRILVEKCSSN